ncbi:MAG: prepilin-type N-terminal cleavage/methylation domain-containing protein [Candidatus Eremiobacteraeota bacterium]|nr:prepilin-type N-terminal cleavage/methylation domain-containing protein [Candidatus Eremiobacteraeota bacterium]
MPDVVRRPTSQDGFTLVELMVVVAIIALIAGIIIPNYVHARRQASVTDTQANLKQIATALELYFADHHDYPNQSSVSVTPTLFGGGNNPYFNSTPTNDVNRASYQYTYSGTNGIAAYYDILDPATYDSTTLGNISLGPYASSSQRFCGESGTCAHIHYDPRFGIYATQ